MVAADWGENSWISAKNVKYIALLVWSIIWSSKGYLPPPPPPSYTVMFSMPRRVKKCILSTGFDWQSFDWQFWLPNLLKLFHFQIWCFFYKNYKYVSTAITYLCIGPNNLGNKSISIRQDKLNQCSFVWNVDLYVTEK